MHTTQSSCVTHSRREWICHSHYHIISMSLHCSIAESGCVVPLSLMEIVEYHYHVICIQYIYISVVIGNGCAMSYHYHIISISLSCNCRLCWLCHHSAAPYLCFIYPFMCIAVTKATGYTPCPEKKVPLDFLP